MRSRNNKTYVTVDDDMPWNKKVRRVTVPARWTYAASICYAGHEETDGVIEKGVLPLLDGSPRLARELVSAGLWHLHPEGWLVHDYLEHNRSKADIEARREKNAANGAKGLATRYGKSSELHSESCSESGPNRSTTRVLPSALLSPEGGSQGEDHPSHPDPENPSEREDRDASESLAIRKPKKLVVQRTSPDDEWLQERREMFGPWLQDFDEQIRFFTNTGYYRTCTDKCGYLDGRLENAVKRENGGRSIVELRSGTRPVEEPVSDLVSRHNAALDALVKAGKAESRIAAKKLLPFDVWRRGEFGEVTEA